MQFSAQSGDELLTGREMWRAVSDRRRLILISAIVGTVLRPILVLVMDRVYRAEVLVSPVQDDNLSSVISSLPGGLGSLAALAGFSPAQNSEVEYTAILQSRSLAEAFINKHKLMPVLFASDWD